VDGPAPVDDPPGVGKHARRQLEGHLGVQAEDGLGGGDLLGAERRAVRLGGVLRVGGGPGDDRPHRHDRGPAGVVAGRLQGGAQRADVLAVRYPLGVPAVGGVASQHVLGEGNVGVPFDGDVVVVIQHHQVAQLLMAGQARRLGLHAFFHVTVGGDDPDGVVEDALSGTGVGVEQAPFPAGRQRHPDS